MRAKPARISFVPMALLLAALAGCGSGDSSETALDVSTDATKPHGSSDSEQSVANAQDGQPDGAQTPSDPAHPVVKMSTSMGDIVIELDAEKAPMTVKNFLWYVSNSHYDKSIFHQIIDGYVVIGGGYTADLVEKKTYYSIRNEAYNGLKNKQFTIAMARIPDQIDSSTSQFFINLADNPQLDHKSRDTPQEYGYCVFGKVVSGTEVLDRMSKVSVSDRDSLASVPVSPITIESVSQVY